MAEIPDFRQIRATQGDDVFYSIFLPNLTLEEIIYHINQGNLDDLTDERWLAFLSRIVSDLNEQQKEMLQNYQENRLTEENKRLSNKDYFVKQLTALGGVTSESVKFLDQVQIIESKTLPEKEIQNGKIKWLIIRAFRIDNQELADYFMKLIPGLKLGSLIVRALESNDLKVAEKIFQRRISQKTESKTRKGQLSAKQKLDRVLYGPPGRVLNVSSYENGRGDRVQRGIQNFRDIYPVVGTPIVSKNEENLE